MGIFQSTDQVCSHRHAFALDNFLRKLFQPPDKIVGPYVSAGMTVLDIGCGPGFLTLPMAELVGDSGCVYAVDLQEEMLARIEKKLSGSPLAGRVRLHNCLEQSLKLDPSLQADFILAYYMVHETKDKGQFFKETRQALKEGGRMLIVEPLFHVSGDTFQEMIDVAERSGFTIVDRPRRKGGRAVLLK